MKDHLGFSVRSLSVCFSSARDGAAALSDVSADFLPGGATAIIGESGSGKSTLGQALFGCLPAGAKVTGQVMFGTKEVTALSKAELRRLFWGKTWNLVPQLPRAALSPVRRIGQQMADVRRGARRPPLHAEEARVLLEGFGLLDARRVLSAYPHELSGGELQRVLSAMAACSEAAWILADEPTKGLDPAAWTLTLSSLRHLRDVCGVSLLLITHDIPLARALADHVIVMRAGRVVETGTDIWTHPTHPYTQAYFRAQPCHGFQVPAKEPPNVSVGARRCSAEGVLPGEAAQADVLLEARGVIKMHRNRMTGAWGKVLDGCSLSLAAGRSIGLEGKSGAGKSTLVRALLGLIPVEGGAVLWQGKALTALPRGEMHDFRRRVQFVAQNPEQAFDPRRLIEESLREVFVIHPELLGQPSEPKSTAIMHRIAQCLTAVELSGRVLTHRPHELSGGELQRLAIGRALLTEPRLLLLDEPTTMLDVSIQAQILHLLKELRKAHAIGMLLISHDRPLLTYFADEIHVLEAGKVR